MVSPRKSWSNSIVLGLSVATMEIRAHPSGFKLKQLTRVVIGRRFVYNKTVGSAYGKILSSLLIMVSSRFLGPEDGGGDIVGTGLRSCATGVGHYGGLEDRWE